MTIYELPPGQAVCPYHFEYGEEEWLLVLDGRPSLRTPDGVEQLAPRARVLPDRAARCPPGAQRRRRAGAVAMFSKVVLPTASAYPDSDKVGVYTGDRDEDLIVERASGVDYLDGEA